MTNRYKKYTAGVYCMESTNADYEHGYEATITTRHGKKIPVIVWKQLVQKDGYTYYSVVRADGFCRTEWLKRKQERAENAAARQNGLADEFYTRSNKDADFLSLAEPIKVGHHSEKRHRKIIKQAQENTSRMVSAMDKAKAYEHKSAELEARANRDINLDTPDCVERLREHIENLEANREALKASKKYESWQLSNLGANIRRYKKRLATAERLWVLDVPAVPPKVVDKKAVARAAMDKLIAECEVIFAFSTQQFDENANPDYTYAHIGAGGYVPTQHIEKWRAGYEAI